MATSLQDKIDDLEARFKAESLDENACNKPAEQDLTNKRVDRVSKSVNFSLASPSPRKNRTSSNDNMQLSQSVPNPGFSPIKLPGSSVDNSPFNLQCPKLQRPQSGTTQRMFGSGNNFTISSPPSVQQPANVTSPKAVFQLETPSPGANNEFANKNSTWVSNSANNSPSTASEILISRPRSAGNLGNLSLGGQQMRKRQVFNAPFAPVVKSQDSAEIEKKYSEIMKSAGILTINGQRVETDITEMEALGELGHGTCGHVIKMMHKPTGSIMAVKQMRRSCNNEENKRIIMDLDVVMKCHSCPYIVLCIGTFITSADVWICMEMMATCLDKLMKKLGEPIPERVLGKVTVATLNALNYLKEKHGVMHRDVKPSNILLDERGRIKLCDFGISGRLVDSKAKTRSAGCAAYMAPERIDPPDPNQPDYDIRADVWSLGLTLVELATGEFPYKNCQTDFELLTKVLSDEQPRLPAHRGFSMDFENFVNLCLIKDYKLRPKFQKLLEHNFVKRYTGLFVDVSAWYAEVTKKLSPSLPQQQHVDDNCNILHTNNTTSCGVVCSGFSINSAGGGNGNSGTSTTTFPTGTLSTNVLNLSQPSPVPPRKSLTTIHPLRRDSSASSPPQPIVHNVAIQQLRQQQQRHSLVLPPHSLTHLKSTSSLSQSTSTSPTPFSYPDIKRFDPLCTDLPTPISSSSPLTWVSSSIQVVSSSSPSFDYIYSHSASLRTGSPFRSPPSTTFSSSLYMVPHQQIHPQTCPPATSSPSPATSSTYYHHINISNINKGYSGSPSSYFQHQHYQPHMVTPSSSSSSLQSDQSPSTCVTPYSAPPLRTTAWSPDNNYVPPSSSSFFSSSSSSSPFHQRPRQVGEVSRNVMTTSINITLSYPPSRSASSSTTTPPPSSMLTQTCHASHYSPSSSSSLVYSPTSSGNQYSHSVSSSSLPTSAISPSTSSSSMMSAGQMTFINTKCFSNFTQF